MKAGEHKVTKDRIPEPQLIKAALRIQKFWRKNGFFNHFLSLQAASCLAIQQGRCDAIFHEMINYCEKEIKNGYDQHAKINLKMMAYALFSMSKPDNYTKDTHFNILLVYLFADKKSLAADITQILKDFYTAIHITAPDEIKSKREIKSGNEFDLAKRREELTTAGKETYWGEKRGVNKTDIVTFIHWGSWRYIKNFLNGREPGYPLENRMGLGLQVSPIQGKIPLEKAFDYFLFYKYNQSTFAIKAQRTFDDPTRLYGQVEAQHILPATNDCEGGIPAISVQHLKSVAIHPVCSLDPEVEYLFSDWGSKKSLLAPYLEQSLFYQRCKQTVDKVSKLNDKQYGMVKTILKL